MVPHTLHARRRGWGSRSHCHRATIVLTTLPSGGCFPSSAELKQKLKRSVKLCSYHIDPIDRNSFGHHEIYAPINGLPQEGWRLGGGGQPMGNLTFSGFQMSISPPSGLHSESNSYPWGKLIGTYNSLYCSTRHLQGVITW